MKQLIAANWKMNGMPEWASKVEELHKLASDTPCELLICPPHPLIAALCQASHNTVVHIGGQDCSPDAAGAHTGETDAALLRAMGCAYVIIGHSERRAGGETDEVVQRKAVRAIEIGLRPIICVGESLDQREAGRAETVVKDQLTASLPELGGFDIAYEPIWAIGTGKTATPQDIAEMHQAIYKAVGNGSRILYGGSVKPANAEIILATEHVGGALVGGASLNMESFAQIAHASQGAG